MKANELMIGDWVSCGGHYRKIQSLEFDNTEEEKCWFWSDEDQALCLLSEHEPIPLTPEILEKNGWHKYYFGTKDISDKVSINYELKNDHTLFLSHYPDEDCFCSAFGMKRIEIRYIHQLQHALRLCGIDKEIVL